MIVGTPSLGGGRARGSWWVLALLGIAGCGPSGGSTCIEGSQQTCGCPGGAPDGVQVCGADGSFGACDCGSSTTTSTGGASSTGGAGTAGTGTGGTGAGGSGTGGTGAGGSGTGGTSTGGTGGGTGTTSTTTLAPCDMVFQGSFTIQNALDVTTITPYCEITGDLTMNSPGLDTLSLPNLRKVAGHISATPPLVAFDLPALESAGGIDVTATTITLSMLATLTGNTTLAAQSPVSLPKLTTSTLLDITAPSTVDLPELVTAAGALGAKSPDATGITFNAPKLTSAKVLYGGPIAVYHLDELTTVAGPLGFTGNGAQSYSFPKLVNTGGLYFITSGTVSAPNLVTISGAIADLDIKGWSGVDLPKLKSIGRDLWLHGSPVTTLHLPALESIGGMFRVGGDDPFADSCVSPPAGANPALVALDLPLLVHLGGAQNNGLLNLGPNPVLPQCVFDAFVAQLQANGWTGLLIAHPNICPLAAGPCP